MVKTAVLVVGMHRSGTSATAGVLHHAGVDFGERLLPGRADNPKGFFEHEEVWQVHEDLLRRLGSSWDDLRPLPASWTTADACQDARQRIQALLSQEFGSAPCVGIKDPRLSRLFPLWHDVLRDASFDVRVVLAVRHPFEVARSLVARDGLSPSHALGLWLRYTLEAERVTRSVPRVVQDYGRLLANWRDEVLRLDQALKLGLEPLPAWRCAEIEAFLDDGLRHQRDAPSWSEDTVPERLEGWCRAAYATIRELHGSDSPEKLDDLRIEVEAGARESLPYDAQIGYALKELRRIDDARTWLESERERLAQWAAAKEADALATRAELARVEAWAERKQIELRAAEAEKVRLADELDLVYRSHSWRVTAPLRRLRSGMPGRSQTRLEGPIELQRPVSAPDLADRIDSHRAADATRAKNGQLVSGIGVGVGVGAEPRLQPAPDRSKVEPIKPNGRLGVLLVTPDIHGPVRNGGIGTAFAALADWLIADGHAVTILYALGAYTETDPVTHWVEHYARKGITFAPLPDSTHFGVNTLEGAPCATSAWRVEQWLRLNEASFDLAIFPEWSGLAYFVLLSKRQHRGFARLAVAVNTHSPESWALEGNHVLPDHTDLLDRDFMERESVRLADWVISPSQYLFEWMRDHGWHLPEHALVMPNLLPADFADPPGSREPVPIHDVVFFGRLEMRKGLKLFCDAIERLEPEQQSVIRRVIFMGKPVVRGNFDSLRYIAQRTALWRMPVEIRSNLDRNGALAELRQPGTLAVIASLLENSPFTVLECLHHRIDFIASAVGGIPELIDVGDHPSTLFAPAPGALAEALGERIGRQPRIAAPAHSKEEVRALWTEWLGALAAARHGADGERRPLPGNARSRPRVTICLTHYERPVLVQQALASIRAQSYPAIEVVLVDDGSRSSESVAMLETLEKEFGLRGWKILRQSNRYLGAARNAAAQAASGEYVLFMDDDNVAMPDEVEEMVDVAKSTDADIVTAAAYLFEGNDMPAALDRVWVPTGAAAGAGMYRNIFGDANALWRRQRFLALGGYTTDYGVGHEDWELFAHAVLQGYHLQLVSKPLFAYRLSQDSMIRRRDVWADHARSARAYLRNNPNGLGLACAYATLLLLARTQDTHAAEVPAVEEYPRSAGFGRAWNTIGLVTNWRYAVKAASLAREQGVRATMRRVRERTKIVAPPLGDRRDR